MGATSAQCNPSVRRWSNERANEAVRILPRISTKREREGRAEKVQRCRRSRSRFLHKEDRPSVGLAAAVVVIIIIITYRRASWRFGEHLWNIVRHSTQPRSTISSPDRDRRRSGGRCNLCNLEPAVASVCCCFALCMLSLSASRVGRAEN